MDGSELVDPALLEGFFESNLNAALGHGFGCPGHVDASATGSREQENGIAVGDPVAAKNLQGALGKRDVAVFGPLAMTHVDEHPRGTVDIGDLKMGAFLKPQPAGVDGGEAGAVERQADTAKDRSNLFRAQDHRELLLPGGPNEGESAPLSLEGFLIEELDATKSNGAGSAGELLDILEIEEILTKLLFTDLVRRFLLMLGELVHGPDIHLLRGLGKPSQLQILGHSLLKLHHGYTFCVWINGSTQEL